MGGGDGTGLVGQTHSRQASSNNYSRLGPSTPAQQFMHPFIWPSYTACISIDPANDRANCTTSTSIQSGEPSRVHETQHLGPLSSRHAFLTWYSI